MINNFKNWLEISRLVWRALFHREHFYIVVAVLDDFEIHQHARHISIKAITPILNHTINNAIEKNIINIKPCEHQQALLDAREQLYAEKRKRGEL